MLFFKKHQTQLGASNHLKHFLWVLLIAGLSACSGGSSSKSDPEPQVIGVEEGVLLEGAETSAAIESTVNRAPISVPLEYIQDQLLTTRLMAVLDLSATVAEVNQALADNNASIVSMREGQPFVSLAIDPVADLAEARARAEALKDSGAFVYVRPGFQAPSASNTFSALGARAGDNASQHTPQLRPANRESAEGYVDHVLSSRFPAAWNLSRAASHDVSLLVAESFLSLDVIGQYDQLPLFSLPDDPYSINHGLNGLSTDDVFPEGGNYGYYILGVAAGEELFDGQQTRKLGADPVAIQYLDAYGLNSCCGLDMQEMLLHAIFSAVDTTNANSILLMDTTFPPDLSYVTYLDRAWAGFMVRAYVLSVEALDGPQQLLVSPAGSTFVEFEGSGDLSGTAENLLFNSALGVAMLENIEALAYLSEEASDEDRQAFIDEYNENVGYEPRLATPLNNVILVGSSDGDGNESARSWPGAPIRAVGENVQGPCVFTVPVICDNNGHTLTMGFETWGDSMAAAAQVAGLAAYMWHIDDQVSSEDLALRLQHAYSSSDIPGVIDARTAVLSLDTSMADAPLRKTLLDVSGPGGQPDGVFDESDVTAFLDAFDAFEGATTPDWSVYDLNGDGWTNGSGTARMDLDVNDLPGFSTVNQTVDGDEIEFDETAVTDIEVLCYYLFSPLFTGNTDNVDMIPGCQSGSQVAILGREVHVTGEVDAIDGFDGDGSTNDLPYYNESLINSGISGMSANCCTQPGVTATASLSTTATLQDTLDSEDNYLQSTQIQFSGQASASAEKQGYITDVGVSASAIGSISAIYYLEATQTSQMSLLGQASNECDHAYVRLYKGSFDANSNFTYLDQLFLYDIDSSLNESLTLETGQYRLSVYVALTASAGISDLTDDPISKSDTKACEGQLTISYQ